MFRIQILTGSGSAIRVWIQIRVPDLVSAKACARIRIPSSLKLSEITVKAGNVVTFGAQNNFFLRISFRWPNVIYSYKIQFKKGLDVGMAIFGFCQHLGPFFFKNVGVTTLPTLRVMSSPPKIILTFNEFTRLRVKSSPWDVFKNILETRTKR
jgi:hypothetical protein